MFMLRLGSRRRIGYDLNSRFGRRNLNILSGCNMETIPHPDTVAAPFKSIPLAATCRVRTEMVRSLLRKRRLERFRLLGTWYMVAIDATEMESFRHRHCESCLSATYPDGTVRYYHPVLEAKIVSPEGLALSIGSEFIENPTGWEQQEIKQDCEQRAFRRLLPRIRKAFRRTHMCLLLDGGFLSQNVVKLAREARVHFIITFKDGSAPAVAQEYETLCALAPENALEVKAADTRQRYRWINEMWLGQEKINVLECSESKKAGKETTFRWATDFHVTRTNVPILSSKGGRCRWKIENEGFNTQKNGGFGLGHSFCEDWTGAKNFYLLMQIAHIICQLLEYGSLLKDSVQKMFGSAAAFAVRLLEAWRTATLGPEEIQKLDGRAQIRLDKL